MLAILILSRLKAAQADTAPTSGVRTHMATICQFMQCVFYAALQRASPYTLLPSAAVDGTTAGDGLPRQAACRHFRDLLSWAWSVTLESSTGYVAGVLSKDAAVTSIEATWLAVHAAGALLPLIGACRDAFSLADAEAEATLGGSESVMGLGVLHILFNNWLYDSGLLSVDRAASADKKRAAIDMLAVLATRVLIVILEVVVILQAVVVVPH